MRKKETKKKDFYDGVHFDLLDAMEEKMCPVCFLVQKSESLYVDNLFYELVNDPGVREILRKSYGFCSKHAQLAKKRGKPLGIAIIYEDICSSIVEQMETDEEGVPIPGKGCCVCRLVGEVQERYLQTFSNNFPSKDFQDRYERSFGLCMPHFLLVYPRLSNKKEKNALKEYQLRSLREYLSDLEEFIRKHDYRFFHEGFAAEKLSWRKVVDKIVGECH